MRKKPTAAPKMIPPVVSQNANCEYDRDSNELSDCCCFMKFYDLQVVLQDRTSSSFQICLRAPPNKRGIIISPLQ